MPHTDLRVLFANLQDELLASLKAARTLPHTGVQGELTEEGWISMLRAQLPQRYCVSRGMVVDCNGETSEQIDVIVHDRQYSPLLFRRGQQLFVPAESVYAVFEVKPKVDSRNLRHAAKKAQSVRQLRRTSAFVHHAGGIIENPKRPFEILAGLLTDSSGWSPPFGKAFAETLEAYSGLKRLDLGCALNDGAFLHQRSPGAGEPIVQVATADVALVVFFVTLLEQLQRLGTVPAIDYTAYRRVLSAAEM